MHTWDHHDLLEEIRALRREPNIRKHLATRSASAIVRMRRQVLGELETALAARKLPFFDRDNLIAMVGFAIVAVGQGCATWELMLHIDGGAGGYAWGAVICTAIAALGCGLMALALTTTILNDPLWRIGRRIEAWRLNRLYRLIEVQRVAYLAKYRAEGHAERIKDLELE